jgi:hypothetical protein
MRFYGRLLPDYKWRRLFGLSGRSGTILCVHEPFDLGGKLEGCILRWEGWFFCGGGLGAEGCEAFDGKHLLAEDLAELVGGLMGQGFESGQFGWLGSFAGLHLVFQAGDGAVCDAAGIDELEVA